MNEGYTNNMYGYWQFTDTLGLSCGVVKYDLVYVFKVKNDMAYALNELGKEISFHKTNITKNYFKRPSYKYHKICELGTKSEQFYKDIRKSAGYKNDCHKCQMYKFKKVVKKFKIKREK